MCCCTDEFLKVNVREKTTYEHMHMGDVSK